MKNKDILITINKIEDTIKLKELGIQNFVYPLKGFCVGMPNTFLVDEINEEGYIFINRILDNEGIDKLKKVLKNIPNNIKGIIFDDLGVYEIIKDKPLEKILYLSHFNTNSKSVNIYLSLVDTVILSTDITKEEIDYIIKNASKKVSLFTYGYVGAMYSRRHLIDNYNKFYNLKNDSVIDIQNNNLKFKVCENEFGTYFYYGLVFNGIELMKMDAKYYFINSAFLDIDEIIQALDGNNKNTDTGFLYQETIYKLKEDE